jgi:hypothetical protein
MSDDIGGRTVLITGANRDFAERVIEADPPED